jgi:hypothetical protein
MIERMRPRSEWFEVHEQVVAHQVERHGELVDGPGAGQDVLSLGLGIDELSVHVPSRVRVGEPVARPASSRTCRARVAARRRSRSQSGFGADSGAFGFGDPLAQN